MITPKVSFAAMLTALFAALFLVSCSKDDGGIDNDTDPECGVNTVFRFSDFEIYNVEVKPNAGNSSVRTSFNIKNKSEKKYIPNDENGEFMVYMKMKASDGAWYDYKYLLNSDINPGASVTSIYTFGVPIEGMTLDPKTFTYEVKCRD